MKLYTIKTFLLDLIFPRHCLNCQKELSIKHDSLICEPCFEKIASCSGIRCHVCGLRNTKGTCRKCRLKTPLKGLFSAGWYQDPVLKEMIRLLKYQSIESLKNPLAKLIISYIEKENLIGRFSAKSGKNSVLVPIPLSLGRKLNRGFNQSELLALEISKYLNLPVINLLKRQKFAMPQAEITDWQKRKENVSGVFCLASDPGNLYQKAVLIDDVSTSGATLEEAARVLKKSGVKEVYGLVAAKG